MRILMLTNLVRLKRLELHSAAPLVTLTPLSCSPNFPRAQYLDIRTLTYERFVFVRSLCPSLKPQFNLMIPCRCFAEYSNDSCSTIIFPVLTNDFPVL